MLYYTNVPKSIYLNPDFNKTEMVLMIMMLDREHILARGKGNSFYCKISWFADEMGVSERHIKDCIKSLCEKGYLDIVKKGRLNHYTVCWDMIEHTTAFKHKTDKVAPTNSKPVMKPITIETFKEQEIEVEQVTEEAVPPTPYEDRYEFNWWVIDHAKGKIPRWMAMYKCKKDNMMIGEVNSFVDNISSQYFEGQYKMQMRDVIARRIKNAS